MVIVPAGLIEEVQEKRRPYTEHLSKKAKAGKIPPAPQGEPSLTLFPTIHFLVSPNTLLLFAHFLAGYSQREAPTIEGTWVRNMVRKLNDGLVSTYLIAVL